MNKYLIGLFVIISQSALTQTKIDSLKIELSKVKQDSIKSKIHFELSCAFETPKEIAHHADLGYKFAISSNSLKYQGLNLYRKGVYFIKSGEIEKANQIFNKAIKLSEKNQLNTPLHYLYIEKGSIHEAKGIMDSAFYYYDKSLKISQELDLERRLNSMCNLAKYYSANSEYKKAVKLFTECLELNNEKENKLAALVYDGLGSVNIKLRNLEKSEFYYRKAIKILDKLNMTQKSHTVTLNLAQVILFSRKRNEETLSLLKDLLRNNNLNDKNLALAYSHLSLTYTYMNKPDKSEEYLIKSIEMSEKSGNLRSTIIRKNRLAFVYYQKANYKKAEKIIRENISLTEKMGQIENIVQARGFLIQNYLKSTKNSQIFQDFMKYIKVNDSLYSKGRASVVKELETQYETQKKENEILKLSNDNIKKEAEAIAKKTQRNYALVGGTLILFLSLFTLRAYRREKKTKEQVLIQKQDIEVLHKELHHRVKNNLAIASSFIKVAKKNFTDSEQQNILEVLQNRIVSMAKIHELMYKQDNVSTIDFQTYIECIYEEISKTYDPIKKNISHTISANIKLPIKEATSLGLIINELITNSYKHAFETIDGGSIIIRVKEDNNKVYCNVDDNGIGISNKKDIMNKNSYGIRLINALVLQLSGKIKTTTKNGTHIEIIFPKNQD